MLIHITCRDKALNSVQLFEYKGVNTPLTSDPNACYMERKTKFHISRGSI